MTEHREEVVSLVSRESPNRGGDIHLAFDLPRVDGGKPCDGGPKVADRALKRIGARSRVVIAKPLADQAEGAGIV